MKYKKIGKFQINESAFNYDEVQDLLKKMEVSSVHLMNGVYEFVAEFAEFAHCDPDVYIPEYTFYYESQGPGAPLIRYPAICTK